MTHDPNHDPLEEPNRVWTADELLREFTVHGYSPHPFAPPTALPLVVVTRKADGAIGTMLSRRDPPHTFCSFAADDFWEGWPDRDGHDAPRPN